METRELFDLGLQADVAMLTRSPIDRRRVLKMGAVGIGLLLAGCGVNTAPAASGSDTAGSGASTGATGCLAEIPSETAGPFPADGSRASSQSLNALTLSGIVRSDIRTSLGTGLVAQGVPNVIELTLVNINNNCAPLANHAVYAWHCDRDGNYSLYSSGVTEQDYLRGVQVTDSAGRLSFTSIFPGCYSGRWPHVHFEVYPSLAQATTASNAILTSQLAFPEDTCKAVYATDGYASSVRNLTQISLASDNIFSDGADLQMATMAGSVASGLTTRLTIGIAA